MYHFSTETEKFFDESYQGLLEKVKNYKKEREKIIMTKEHEEKLREKAAEVFTMQENIRNKQMMNSNQEMPREFRMKAYQDMVVENANLKSHEMELQKLMDTVE